MPYSPYPTFDCLDIFPTRPNVLAYKFQYPGQVYVTRPFPDTLRKMAEVEVWEQGVVAGSPGNTLARQSRPRRSIWKSIEEKWGAVQIESQGAYSVERLESLSLYCKTTSRGRVILLCFLSPVPALATALVIESLPLRSPSEGWAANWVFWVRLLLVQLILSFASTSHMTRLIPGLNFTIGKIMALSMGKSTAFVGICLLAADKIGFPVPLMMQLAPVPIGIVNLIMTFLVLGSVLFAKTSPLKAHADRFNRFLLSILALAAAFPIYKLLFQQVPDGYRGVAVVILPIWKFAAKQFMVSSTRRLEDIMPLAVAFCVDFLSTLFIAVFSAGIPNDECKWKTAVQTTGRSEELSNSYMQEIRLIGQYELAGTEATQALNKIVVRGVQLLFHAEYVALVQYVESMVPIVFLIYKSVLEHLPNVVYYPGGAGAWDMQSTSNTALFAVMEVVLLLFFDTLLRHKFGFSPLYQVAFVLETEFHVVQSMLFGSIIFVLQYDLEHFVLQNRA
ncbi:hypothetical protein ON010_g461 [Phytophthora cinnamomi]|nr:hypothetical protein ON010_g461 [Phytophthora cinnamomi]